MCVDFAASEFENEEVNSCVGLPELDGEPFCSYCGSVL